MRSQLLEWARASLVPLSTVLPGPPWDDVESLGDMIGDASVVALGEGAHGAAEALEFRNRLLQYMVEHKGCSAVAIESGIIEGRCVHDYVRNGVGDLDRVMAQGITWDHDQIPQNRALIHWLREYNSNVEPCRKVNFYGFDLPGCPSRAREYFGHGEVLGQVLQFLDRVDRSAGGVFRARLDPFANRIRFHPRRSLDGPCYGTMSESQRDSLTAVIADLVIWIERHEAKYSAASTADEYAWGYRAAIGARQMDNWLRQVPVGWTPLGAEAALSNEPPFFSSISSDIRDRAQADNLSWIIEREGAEGKFLVYASRYHLSAAPLAVTWSAQRGAQEQQLAGTYLRRRLGTSLVTIGNLIGRGEVACGDRAHVLGPAPAESLDGLAKEVGVPLFLLDLRRAPAAVADWLNQKRRLVAGRQVIEVSVRQAFDILFYVDVVTPAERAAGAGEYHS